MSPPMERRFVVALGNPGRKYARTRHNVGFQVLDVLRQRWMLDDGREAFESLCWEAQVTAADRTRPVFLLAPKTYMNDSGRAVRKMMDFYKVQPESVLVVLDDLALRLGQLRIRASGSAGGQKGLGDILRCCGDRIPRLRVGIGAPPGGRDASDYVLGRFSKEESEQIGVALQQAADVVEEWLFDSITEIMNKFNANAGK